MVVGDILQDVACLHPALGMVTLGKNSDTPAVPPLTAENCRPQLGVGV